MYLPSNSIRGWTYHARIQRISSRIASSLTESLYPDWSMCLCVTTKSGGTLQRPMDRNLSHRTFMVARRKKTTVPGDGVYHSPSVLISVLGLFAPVFRFRTPRIHRQYSPTIIGSALSGFCSMLQCSFFLSPFKLYMSYILPCSYAHVSLICSRQLTTTHDPRLSALGVNQNCSRRIFMYLELCTHVISWYIRAFKRLESIRFHSLTNTNPSEWCVASPAGPCRNKSIELTILNCSFKLG